MVYKTGKRAGTKLSLILLSVILFLLLLSPAAAATMYGDVNEDGVVDIRDVVMVQQHVLSATPKLTDAQIVLADVNSDGAVNAIDVSLMMRYVSGMISEFPVGTSTSGVKSVRAIATDSIAVEFYQTPSVAEKAAMTITIRNASNLVVPTVTTWDGDVAKVSRLLTKFNVGTYSVEVLGITPPYNGYVVITAASAVNLKIEATTLPINTERAPLRVRLLDQYGSELPILNATFDKTAYNLTTHAPVTVNFDPTAGFYIDTRTRTPHEIAFNVGDQIRVTFVHRATGIEETVVVTVTPEIHLGSVTFGDVILPITRTVLTRDLTNIRIPFTAKDQHGNPLVLVNGANVRLSSSDQSVIANTNLRFAWFDGEQYILIERFSSKGPVIISVLGTPGGVVGNKFLNVEEGLPFQLVVFREPATTLLPAIHGRTRGISTSMVLHVVDQFGVRVSPVVADQSFELVTIKSSGGNSILVEPVNNARHTLQTAGSSGITISSGMLSGVNDTITFRLQRKDGTFIDSVSRVINIIEDFTRLSIQADRSVYEAGETVSLTIKAMLNNQLHEDYNNTSLAVIRIKNSSGITIETVNRIIIFRDGVATTTMPAKVAGTNLRVTVEFSSYPEYEADERITVLPGIPSRFRIVASAGSTNMTVMLTDSQDNVITSYNQQRLLTLTYPDSATPPANIDSEQRLLVNFANGEAVIVFGAPLVTGTYSVEDEALEIKRTISLTN